MSDNLKKDFEVLWSNLEQKEFDVLCKKLEAERNDISYRMPAVKPQPTETEQEREKRDAIFYNAGRFIQGATDKTALKAHQALQRIIASESD